MVIGEREIAAADFERMELSREYIQERRAQGNPAKVYSPDPINATDMASLIAAGGIVALPWGQDIRKIYILVGQYDDPQAMQGLNEIKGRPPRQVLGIGSLPDTISQLAKIEESRPLISAAQRIFGTNKPDIKNLTQIIDRLFEDNSIGLLFEAREFLPEAVTDKLDNFKRSVLILGASDNKSPHDIYNNTLWELGARYGTTLGGTSANPHGKNAYSVSEGTDLYSEMSYKVDAVVLFDRFPQRTPKRGTGASSTMIDLTNEKPVVKRWGNQHPDSFRNIFPELRIAEDVKREVFAEGKIGFLIRKVCGL